jgi:hypothetical protein
MPAPHHIDVSSVLRGSVCDLYSNLVTRPTGAAVRSAIEQLVANVGRPTVTTIDFSHVMLLDFSCADEIVAKLLLRYVAADGPPGYLLFRGIHDGHRDPVEAVLERHALALVACSDDGQELVGTVSHDERTLWEFVRDRGPTTADAAAARLQVPLDTMASMLTQLCQRRVLMSFGGSYLVPHATQQAA